MTFEELKAAGFVEHHRCGACDDPVGYLVHPDMAAACFNSGCSCSGGFPNHRILTHEELAAVPGGRATPPAHECVAQIVGVGGAGPFYSCQTCGKEMD
jgi:hypothetical protein